MNIAVEEYIIILLSNMYFGKHNFCNVEYFEDYPGDLYIYM